MTDRTPRTASPFADEVGHTPAAPPDDDVRRPDAPTSRHAPPDPPRPGPAIPEVAIPDVVIRRLPVYVRTLRGLHGDGVLTVSSDELAGHIGVTAAQIRRDLSYFGRFGKQGRGYETGFLADRIAEILRVDSRWDVALAGVGNLGQAVLRYRGFSLPSSPFNIVAVFDRGHHGRDDRIDGIPILSTDRMTAVILDRAIRVGIIAVPAVAAQGIADRMVAGGVRALLNYAPVVLKVPDDVTVREIDPVSALQSMTYYLRDG